MMSDRMVHVIGGPWDGQVLELDHAAHSFAFPEPSAAPGTVIVTPEQMVWRNRVVGHLPLGGDEPAGWAKMEREAWAGAPDVDHATREVTCQRRFPDPDYGTWLELEVAMQWWVVQWPTEQDDEGND